MRRNNDGNWQHGDFTNARKVGDLVAPRDLQLGDSVELFNGAYGTAMVRQIEADRVHLDRPYATHADFSYTGGVLVTFGIEHVTYFFESSARLLLLCEGGVEQETPKA